MSTSLSISLRVAALSAISGILLAFDSASAVPTWGVDLTNATMQLDVDAYADNGQNGFKPPGVFFEDADSATEADVAAGFMGSFFGQAPDTYDLGAGINVFGTDSGFNPDFSTLASASSLVAIDGVGTRELTILWRATTANEQNGLGGEGFLSRSMAAILAQIEATIDGVAPSSSLTIGYDWEYNGAIVIDHEAAVEDPTSASGSSGFVDEQGTGPGNVLAILFAEPGPLGGVGSGSGSYNIVTSNTADPSFVSIDVGGRANTVMDAPGNPPGAPLQHDQAGSTFNGRITLTLPIPEPATSLLMLFGVASLARLRRR